MKKKLREQNEEKFKPLEVIPRGNESIERMLKRFTKAVRADGILQEFSDRRHYVKNSTKRRKKHQTAAWTVQNNIRK